MILEWNHTHATLARFFSIHQCFVPLIHSLWQHLCKHKTLSYWTNCRNLCQQNCIFFPLATIPVQKSSYYKFNSWYLLSINITNGLVVWAKSLKLMIIHTTSNNVQKHIQRCLMQHFFLSLSKYLFYSTNRQKKKNVVFIINYSMRMLYFGSVKFIVYVSNTIKVVILLMK